MSEQQLLKSSISQYREELSVGLYKGSSWYELRRSFFLKALSRESKKRYKYALAVLRSRASAPLSPGVQSGLRHYAVLYGRMKAMEGLVTEPLNAITAIVSICPFIVICIILANRENIYDPFMWVIVGSMFFAGSFFGSLYLMPKRLKFPTLLVSPLLGVIAALALRNSLLKDQWLAVIGQVPGSPDMRAGAYALIVGSTLTTLLILGTSVAILADAIIIGRHRRRYPYVGVLSLLLQVRRALAEHDSRMSDSSFKRYVSLTLERCAINIEGSLGQRFALNDLEMQREIELVMRQAATELRLMQVRFILSDGTTMEEIRDEVTEFICAVATGSYALLPTAKTLIDRKRGRRALTIVKDIIVAATPLAVLKASRYLDLNVSPVVWNWGIVACLTWAAISVIALLDPLYKSKIADMRDIISIIRNKD